MGRDRSEAASADRGHAGALELDPARRLRVGRRRHEVLLTAPDLERERTLAGFREDFVRLEAVADLAPEAEPIEAAGREHDRVQAALPTLAKPRVDVPAERLDRERRLQREQQRSAPDRRGADPHPGLDPG